MGAVPLPTCLTELPQGLRQTRRLRGWLLRGPRGPPLAPRPFRAIPRGLEAPQGHGQRVTAANRGGRRRWGQRGALVLPRSQWEPQNTSLRSIQNGGGGGGGGELLILPPQVPVDRWQSPPQARSPTVCLQRESVGLGQSELDPWPRCEWGDSDVENPRDSSESLLLHHLTPSIQSLPRPSSRDRRIESARDQGRLNCGEGEGCGVGGGGRRAGETGRGWGTRCLPAQDSSLKSQASRMEQQRVTCRHSSK